MNTLDIISYGHKDVLSAVDGLSDDAWLKTGVTTHWSAKDIMAHLASYEHLLIDALNSVLNPALPTPDLKLMVEDSKKFNDQAVILRRDKPAGEVLKEYIDTHLEAKKILEDMPPDLLSTPGIIPWYGNQYSLEDFIVYASYGHKQGHVAQIKGFRKRENL